MSQPEADDSSDSKPIDLEERFITVLLAIGMPFLIGFIAFGVIIYAFAEWKLY